MLDLTTKSRAATAPVSQAIPWQHKLLAAAGLLAVLLATFIYACCWLFASHFPYAIEYEGHVLWACKQLADGLNIYGLSGLSNAPFSVVIYTPLFFAVGAPLLKLFGISYIPLRLISIASTVACFVGLAQLLTRSRLADFQILIAVTLLACTTPILHWSCMARVDMLGLALAIFGIERFVAARSKSSMLLFALAVFTKQQYIVFPIACVISMLLERRFSVATKYGACFAAIVGLVSAAIQLVTGGYFEHLSFAAGLPWEWSTLKQFLIPFFLDPKVIVCAALLIACSAIASRRPTGTNMGEKLPLILLLCSLLPALYTMGLRGAFHNHLLCTYFALFWLTATTVRSNWSYALLVAAALLSIEPLRDVPTDLAYRSTLFAPARATVHLIQPQHRVLSEDPSLPMLAGSKPDIVDATTFTNTFARHAEQRSALLAAINNRTYDLIIINKKDAEENRAHIWPIDVVQAIRANYVVLCDSGGNGMRQDIFSRRTDY